MSVYTGSNNGFMQSTYVDQQGTALPGDLAYASDVNLIDACVVSMPVGSERDLLPVGVGVVGAYSADASRPGMTSVKVSPVGADTTAAQLYGVTVRNQQCRTDENNVSGWGDGDVGNVMRTARVGGRIAGALAVDISTEQPAFVPVRAKTVLLATGLTHRLYMNASTPGFMFNTGHCPNCAGGQGLGWGGGARMVNMEFPYTHAGPKFFARVGKSTWIGVYRYPDGKPIGPFATKSDPQYGDVTSDIWNSVFEDVMRKGTGPAYMDCSDATDEQMAYMRWAMTGEGLTALLTYMEKEGIDPQKHGVEFMRYEPILHGRGLDVSDEGETSVPGLFAAGDLVGNGGCGIALAAYLGWEGGMTAAAQAATVDFQPAEETESIRKRMELLSSFMDRPEGADWKDADMALQQIMSDYAPAGPAKVRSETLLNAGRDYLKQLRHSAERQMGATCSHTLMRAAEVLDLMDCGEAIMNAALARRS